jgi:lipoyl synthase
MSINNQQSTISNPCSLPRWLKRNVPKGNANHFTSKLIGELGLHTVCDHAKCPNRMECYSQKTATFLILGDTCTRACRFCSVPKGKPLPPDADEPRRVAEAVAKLQLEHAVITCVTRDDLPDGGAEHFVQTIAAIRSLAQDLVPTLGAGTPVAGRSALHGVAVPRGTEEVSGESIGHNLNDFAKPPPSPSCPKIEVLPSDFAGNAAAVDRLVDAVPDVYNHNTETVPRLFHVVRDQRTDYAWTLEMFRRIRRRNPAIALKTGLMLGLGETTEELLDTLADLFAAGCRLLTLGQYLQPSPRQMPVVRFVPPEEFEHLGQLARRIGFERVAAGPFVRSSYHAREMANAVQKQ